MMSDYADGYNRVMKTAGLEKTALNERLLQKFLSSKYGPNNWDTRNILKNLRTGEKLPIPEGAEGAGLYSARRGDDTELRSTLNTFADQVNPRPEPQRLASKRMWRKGYKTPEGSRMKELADKFPDRPIDQAQAQRASRTMASGRHRTDAFHDASSIRTIDKDIGGILGGPGYNPETLAWRGRQRNAVRPIPDESGRWVTGHPDISTAYARGDIVKHRGAVDPTVSAYGLENVPRKQQGPWTNHIGIDARSLSAQEARGVTPRSTGGWSDSPTFEKVISQGSLHPAESHRYKLLPDDRLMRVKGDAATDPLRK